MRRRNRGWFKTGQDARRHQLTKEERRRGGDTRWLMTMVEVRSSMNLPIPRYVLEVLAQRGKL